MGELFLKLAAKYCHNMDKGNHTDIFEPIQLALDSPSGAERAMQRVQKRPSRLTPLNTSHSTSTVSTPSTLWIEQPCSLQCLET